MEDKDFYELLGLPRDATQDEIRRAYRQLVLHLHPDRNVNKGDTELFIDIQQAYEQLSDPRKRADYDTRLPPEDPLASPLIVKTTYSQPLIARISEPQLVYALLDLNLKLNTDLMGTSTPLNICMAVDCSTSMQGVRLDAVKQTTIDLLRKLQPADTFSLVKFNDFAELLISPSSVSDIKSSEMKVQILQAGGGTEIFKGLDLAFTQVKQNLARERINHILLITDGRTYGDEVYCEQLADQCSAIGIGISALGIGSEWNDKFLDHITSKTGGICKFIPEIGDLHNTILEEISRLGSNLTEQILFSFQIPQNVSISSAFRLQPDATPLEKVSPINLGDMPRVGTMSILFEFVVKDIPDDISQLTFVKGFLNFEIPRLTRKTRFVNRMLLDRPVSNEPVKSMPPSGILNAITLLSLYHMQERATEQMSKGDSSSAARYMENMATSLLKRGEHNLAQSVLDEVTNIRNNQTFTEEGEKRIKYGTRSLLLPSGSKQN